jgi:hypothetical protein
MALVLLIDDGAISIIVLNCSCDSAWIITPTRPQILPYQIWSGFCCNSL